MGKGVFRLASAAAVIGLIVALSRRYGLDAEAAMSRFGDLRDRLGVWAIPVFVLAHTLTLALCLPSAVLFETGASLLFGFLPAVFCVFSAKILGASLSFWIGRAVFRSSKSAREMVQTSRYFHIVAKGVEQDGWKFVLLARFSPLPSYVINYAMAATEVGFFVDFLFPTVLGCLPMILQNTSVGSLAGAAVASSTGSKKLNISSYLYPLLGIGSSVLISLRIKKYSAVYSSGIAVAEELKSSSSGDTINGDKQVAEKSEKSN